MKVLLLADVNSSHTQKWAEGICSLGYPVCIFSLSEPHGCWHESAQVTVKWSSRTRLRGRLRKLSYLAAIGELRKTVSEFRPDLVHAHYATSYGMLGALLGIHPLMISAWGTDVSVFPKKSFVHLLLIKWILGKADAVHCAGKEMATELRKYTRAAIHIVPFGIDPEKFYPVRPAGSGEILTMGIVKSLEAYYGIAELIEAFGIVTSKYGKQNLRLLIAGEGSQRTELERLAGKCGAREQIIFTGKIPQENVPAIHNEIDIFVNPSYRESFGVSVLEAQACGRPVIVTDTGGLREVMTDGVTGKRIPVGDVKALSEAMSWFIANPDEISRFGFRARQFVERNYNWKDNLRQISDIYRRL